ncbi:hypothetical protein DFJ74DRAFT_668777 [Hyaloraphidium curvatum]|nr:hypothetical protein DFJ74DRAFT_668777 [Hyaloraphidium curvatum]
MAMKGRVALVTGATEPEGIGLAIVERLLKEGTKVMISNRSSDLGETVVADLKAKHAGAEVAFARMDLEDHASIVAAYEAAESAFGPVDIVVANAGFITETSAANLLDGKYDAFVRGIHGHLSGTMLLGNLAASRWLKDDRAGVFIVTSSVGGMHGYFDVSFAHTDTTYPVVKAGQIQYVAQMQRLVDGIAKDKGAAPSKIRFACIAPGPVFTRMWQGVAKTPEEVIKFLGPDMLDQFGGGFTPMEDLVDAYVRCIEDDGVRGKTFSVSGPGGEAKEFPKGFDLAEYVSRAKP